MWEFTPRVQRNTETGSALNGPGSDAVEETFLTREIGRSKGWGFSHAYPTLAVFKANTFYGRFPPLRSSENRSRIPAMKFRRYEG